MQSQSQQKGAGMCARFFYIPQKLRRPAGMCWQRQELTQVAQGREQVGLLMAKSLTPSSQFLFIHGGEDVRSRLLHIPLPHSPLGQTVGHQERAGIPYLISLIHHLIYTPEI